MGRSGRRRQASSFAALCCVLLLASLPTQARPPLSERIGSVPPDDHAAKAIAAALVADDFTQNAGQLGNDDVLFYTTSGDVQVGFAESAVLVKIVERESTRGRSAMDPRSPDPSLPEPPSSRGVLVRIVFEGSNPVRPEGVDPLPYRSNYFLGSDPAGWRTDVTHYGQVVYRELYDGVDVAYRIGAEGLKYDITVRPGADPGRIVMAYEGVEGLEAGNGGRTLVVDTALGDLSDAIPRSYQGDAEVSCTFDLRTPRAHGFACRGWDPARALVIDPLVYSTYLGGGGDERGRSVAVDASGSAYVAGDTSSTNFPATPGAFEPSLAGGTDVFLAKLNASGGGLLYATYLGGGGDDGESSVAADASGNAYVAGITVSTDFPTTPDAFDTLPDGVDAFVAKLNATGSGLLYATYLGGGSYDRVYAVAVDASGSAYVTGQTGSADFPTTLGAFDRSIGVEDAFVTKLNATGSGLLYSTYLGGGAGDWGHSITVDDSGSVYVAGGAGSADFPTTPDAFDPTFNNGGDAFVAKLTATGGGLLYSTYLGGSNDDRGLSVAVDAQGSAYVTGDTFSTGFPTTPGAFDTTINGFDDAFVAKLNATGGDLLYATYLGGGNGDLGYSIAVDASGSAHVLGYTISTDFPTTLGALDASYNGERDAFVAKLSATGGGLLNATYLGGGGYDEGYSVALDASGRPYVAGWTNSTDFPTTPGAFDTMINGFGDAFVAKLSVNTPPALTLLSPLGGEVWDPGSVHAVMWTASDDFDLPASLVVFLNYTSSAGSGPICGPVPGSPGPCEWIVPSIVATDVVVNISVIDTDGLEGWDQSGPFTIRAPPSAPPDVTLTSPLGGERWLGGSTHAVTWSMQDDEDADADLTVYVNYTTGGVATTVVATLEGRESYQWTLPNIEATDVVVNITVIDTGGRKGWDESGPFTIEGPRPPQDFLSQCGWPLLLLFLAVVLVLFLLAWKRRKKREVEARPSETQSPPQPPGA